MQKVLGSSLSEAAYFSVVIWLSVGIFSTTLGMLVNRYFSYRLLMTVCGLVGVANTVMLFYGPQLSYNYYFVICVLFGFASAGQILTFS